MSLKKAPKSPARYIFFIIVVLAIIGQAAADMYLPSLPSIVVALHSNKQIIQLTITVYLAGLSASQLIYGPISDAIGRRKIILLGITICFLGSLIAVFATSDWMLIIGRFIQGIGIGGCVALTRAVIRDVFSGIRMAKLGSQLSMVSSLTLAIAPTLGGYLQKYFGWRASFIFLLMYTLFAWIVTWYFLPETNKKLNPSGLHWRGIFNNYYQLLSHRAFIGFLLCSGLAFSGGIAYATASPFLFQIALKLTPVQYGALAFCIAGSLVVGAFSNVRLISRLRPKRMLQLGAFLMLTSGILMALFRMLDFLNVYVVIIPVMIYTVGASFIFANSVAGAFTPFAKTAGVASAIFGSMQVLVAAITGSVIILLHEHDQLPLAIVYMILGALTLGIIDFLIPWKESK